MSAQTELMLFEVEKSTGADGVVRSKAKKVVRECSVKRAAAMLEVSEQTVRRYYKAGILAGWQPGLELAKKLGKRKDKREKNVKIVLDWDSVAEFRQSQRATQDAARSFLG